MIKIAVPGVNGRMGAAIAQQVLSNPSLTLSAATVRSGNQLLGTRVPGSEVVITADFSAVAYDVLIDFTLPAGVIEHLQICVERGKPIVIGTTGFSVEQQRLINAAAERIPVLQSANMSFGVNLCFKVLAEIAAVMDESWQVKIYDLHHAHKKDAPSGTAKRMQKIISEKLRGGNREVAIASERVGDTVGVHKVTFDSLLEQINLEHIAKDRSIFAHGAVLAAIFLHRQLPGLYSSMDLLQ